MDNGSATIKKTTRPKRIRRKKIRGPDFRHFCVKVFDYTFQPENDNIQCESKSEE